MKERDIWELKKEALEVAVKYANAYANHPDEESKTDGLCIAATFLHSDIDDRLYYLLSPEEQKKYADRRVRQLAHELSIWVKRM